MSGQMFTLVPILVFVTFAVVVIVVIFSITRTAKMYYYNNSQAVLSVLAKVVSKRTEVSSTSHINNDISKYNTYTKYYVTFQVESGDRLEFLVHGYEYWDMEENNEGKLTFQGNMFIQFNKETK